MKILVYGTNMSDMRSIADRLYKDNNQGLYEPRELRNDGALAVYFASTRKLIGLMPAVSREAVVEYARTHDYSLDGVILIAASSMVDAAS